MAANPVLAEAVRGDWVENRHRGAFVVSDADGNIIASAGDIDTPVFPRSAVKSMQAMAMAASGALERFDIDVAELALSASSHQGEPMHVAGVQRFLDQVGATPGNLECGAHWPNYPEAREALRDAGEEPSALHNNCSGKHSGMLAVARALGVDPHGYVERDHPVQVLVRQGVEAVIGTALHEDRCGRDGCSIPTWAAPLSAFATGFARMATGNGLPPKLAAAAQRVFDAAAARPELVAGTGHFDTLSMRAFGGRLMQKGGAEGVQCGAIRDRGWGYALKCDDGNMDASRAMVAGLLLAISSPDAEQAAVLTRFARKPITNVRGFVVGELRATPEVSPAL